MLDIVILAAGQGKRMHSALPKVLHPLAGQALAAHVLTAARSLKPRQLCIVHGHGGDVVRVALDAPDLDWALQEPQLGTGHALQQALPCLGADGITLVLYGDVPLIQPSTLRQLLHAAGSPANTSPAVLPTFDNLRLAVLTLHLDNPTGYGRIIRDAHGQIARIVEQKDASPAEAAITEINTGIMAIPTAHLRRWLAALSNDNAQGEYYLTDIIALAAADGVPIVATHPAAAWEVQGVNNKRQLAELERDWQREQAHRLLDAGVRLADPGRIDVRGRLDCGRDVFIDINNVFCGLVQLGDAVEVGPNCVLENVRVGAGSRIAAFSHLVDADIGPDCVVGPYARLRPGAQLAAGVHVGNFVEIKKSRLGPGSKANHLAYLGDADIGARVNIGAGTITCNYDGVNKFRTVIEDDAFIGSDTQLVAPVTVGRGATVGAGTTLTKDAPADALTVSRARQTTLNTWKRPQKNKQ